jgi:hypothetical protein
MHKPKWNEKKWDPKIMAWVADDGDGIPIYKLIDGTITYDRPKGFKLEYILSDKNDTDEDVEGNARVIDSGLTYGANVGGKSLIRNCTLRGNRTFGDCELTNVRTSATYTHITNSTITCGIRLPDYDDIFNANIRHKHDYFISPYFFAYNDKDGNISFLFKDEYSDKRITLDKYDEYVATYNEHLQPYFKYMKPIVVRYLRGEFHHE